MLSLARPLELALQDAKYISMARGIDRIKPIVKYNPDDFDIPDWGPAMRALSFRQRAFVTAMFELSDHPTQVECARAAGYSDPGAGSDTIHIQAHRLMASDKIQAAIREEADRRMVGMLPLATKRHHDLVQDKLAKDHWAAVKHAQALTGQSPKQVHVVEHIENRSAMIQEIKGSLELLRALGVQIEGNLVPVEITDVEYEEVENRPSDGTEGLEDLL